MKTCLDCFLDKGLDKFYNAKDQKDGKDKYCKSCRNVRGKMYQRKTGFRYPRRHNLKVRYGVTPEWYDLQLKQQNGLCAICGSNDPKSKEYFSIDHSHATGKVRALLCNLCNIGLGSFRESGDFLRRAADYIDFHNERVQS